MTDPEKLAALAQAVPDYIDLFRLMRAAGRSNRVKATAVRERLVPIEAALRALSKESDNANG